MFRQVNCAKFSRIFHYLVYVKSTGMEEGTFRWMRIV